MIEINRQSKYIKNPKIKLSKKFIASIIINHIIQAIVFLGIVGGLGYLGYETFFSDKVPLANGSTIVVTDKEPIHNSIVAVSEDKIDILPLDKLQLALKQKKAYSGKIVGIPYEFVEYKGKKIQLQPNEYLVKFKKNTVKLNKDHFYGVK